MIWYRFCGASFSICWHLTFSFGISRAVKGTWAQAGPLRRCLKRERAAGEALSGLDKDSTVTAGFGGTEVMALVGCWGGSLIEWVEGTMGGDIRGDRSCKLLPEVCHEGNREMGQDLEEVVPLVFGADSEEGNRGREGACTPPGSGEFPPCTELSREELPDHCTGACGVCAPPEAFPGPSSWSHCVISICLMDFPLLSHLPCP